LILQLIELTIPNTRKEEALIGQDGVINLWLSVGLQSFPDHDLPSDCFFFEATICVASFQELSN
jgi:hypothetical protein